MSAMKLKSPISNLKSQIPDFKSRRGFTLIELMVSMALVLILILGVNAVFRLTSDTVNAGMALSAADRDNRAVQPVLYNDMQTAVLEGAPFFIIRSERVAAFRNRADELADRDIQPSDADLQRDLHIRTIDINGNNQEGEAGVAGETISPVTYNSRNHRIDSLRFFANHLYRRQTGGGSVSGTNSANRNQLISDNTVSNEAMIWYGHVTQPDFTTPLTQVQGEFEGRKPGVRLPGGNPTDKNRDNYYATDWILGRVAMLLQEAPDRSERFIRRNPSSNAQTGGILTPLSENSQAGDRENIQWSRYDLAQTSIAGYRQILSDVLQDPQLNPTTDFVQSAWYRTLSDYRFQGYRYPDRPLTARGVARTTPVLLPGCTQFIVEYAGDYLNQTAAGRIQGTFLDPNGTDGQVDFIVTNNTSDPANDVRRIRWYGFPRNVDTSDDVNGVPMVNGGPRETGMLDVVPLRDLLLAAGKSPADLAPNTFWEHFENLPPQRNYAASNGVPFNARYVAAWNPSDLTRGSLKRPRMIRITMVVDDPQGRLTEGQTYEYVIDLP